jgi:hypothetical protein
MERHGGLESLLGWIRRECRHQLLAAQSWPDLHRVLHAHGLSLHERGTGFVVKAANGTAVKASSIDPSCSRPGLEQRIGVYAPPRTSATVEAPSKIYVKQPLPCCMDTTALYAQYRQTQQQAGARSAAEREAARAGKEQQIAAVKQRTRLKRAGIRLATAPGLARRLLYRSASKTLQGELCRIQKTYREQREAISNRYQRRSWVDWLREKAIEGDRQALAVLRTRAAVPGLPGNTMTGVRRPSGATIAVPCDGITKNGTVIYRFGSTAVRDDGNKLMVSRGASAEGLQAALRMALLRYGPVLRVGGTNAFKEDIVQAAVGARLAIRFDDALLESRRRCLLEQVSARIDAPHQGQTARRQPTTRTHLDHDRLAATAIRRGSGRHRSGP